MSNFPFVRDRILQPNLDTASDHVIKLISLTLSKEYVGQEPLISSLRKTIIIHTAAIVEALLLWKLKQFYKTANVELPDEWKYYEIKIFYEINKSEQIIAGKRRKEIKELDKIDFFRIIDLCCFNKIIKSDKLEEELDIVREFRNRLHIGGLKEIEKEYSVRDLEFCFRVQEKVKKLVSK